jgi:outer membrane protein assembly factor BamB
LLAVRRANGGIVWDTAVVGRRPGAAYAEISSISGDPVVDGNRVYAANQSGRVMALDAAHRRDDLVGGKAPTARSGRWAARSSWSRDENRLMRLDAPTAAVIWAVDLPLYTTDRPRRGARSSRSTGRSWPAGGCGWFGRRAAARLRPVTRGAALPARIVPGGAASAPIVGGRQRSMSSAGPASCTPSAERPYTAGGAGLCGRS